MNFDTGGYLYSPSDRTRELDGGRPTDGDTRPVFGLRKHNHNATSFMDSGTSADVTAT